MHLTNFEIRRTVGAIKDIHDLTVQLINSVKDRKLVAIITNIQSHITALQSEQFSIVEKNTQLLKENGELQEKHRKEIADIEALHMQKVAQLEAENKKLRTQIEENSLRDPMGDRFRSISEFFPGEID